MRAFLTKVLKFADTFGYWKKISLICFNRHVQIYAKQTETPLKFLRLYMKMPQTFRTLKLLNCNCLCSHSRWVVDFLLVRARAEENSHTKRTDTYPSKCLFSSDHLCHTSDWTLQGETMMILVLLALTLPCLCLGQATPLIIEIHVLTSTDGITDNDNTGLQITIPTPSGGGACTTTILDEDGKCTRAMFESLFVVTHSCVTCKTWGLSGFKWIIIIRLIEWYIITR